MARFCSLFSSSSGNCTFVGSASTGILIDAGVSAKKIKNALSERDIDPKTIKAIFVTHEHIDHIRGIRVLASSLSISVYATQGTTLGMQQANALSEKISNHIICAKSETQIGDLLVKSFPTPHDCNESCGFTIEFPDERRAAVATDIGHMTDEIMNSLRECDLVMLESNHDIGMLQNGRYPYYLKERILSDVGHLSNSACADAAAQLVRSGTTRIFLGHLSGENNMPLLAYQTNLAAIEETGAKLERDYLLKVNPKENSGGIVRF